MTEHKLEGGTTIRFAHLGDLADLMQFVETQWKAGHVFARDKEFFLYEYAEGDALNFVISRGPNNELNGMLGFLKSSRDPDSDRWTTMWKVVENTGNPVLGLQLLEYLTTSCSGHVMSVGINLKTVGLYKYLGYTTGVLNHHVVLNETKSGFRIAIVPKDGAPAVSVDLPPMSRRFVELSRETLSAGFAQVKEGRAIPKKDLDYYLRRFFGHPKFEYRVWGIFLGDLLTAHLVTRTVLVDDATALRIVDFRGPDEELLFASEPLRELVREESHEYVDFLSYGVDLALLSQAGFWHLDLDSTGFVVPNYFQPFVQCNVKIFFFADMKMANTLRVFKADGDQDRPG